jgi:acyl carrier protein
MCIALCVFLKFTIAVHTDANPPASKLRPVSAGRIGVLIMIETVRQLLEKHGRLHISIDLIANDADLYDAGLTPFAAIRTMLALEEAFDVEFSVAMLRRQSFATVDNIVACLQDLNPPVAGKRAAA